jgi:hypothetical protein
MMPRWTSQFQEKVASYALDLEASKGMPLEKMIHDPIMKRDIVQHVQGLWKDTVNSNLALMRGQFVSRLTKSMAFRQSSKTQADLAKRDESESLADFVVGFFTMATVIIIGMPVVLAMLSISWIVCQSRRLAQGLPKEMMEKCMDDVADDVLKRFGI